MRFAKRLLAILNSPVLWVLLACIPATLIFLNRFLIPDLSSDTLSYHLFNGQQGLHNPLVPFLHNEFYPVGVMSINPVYDSANTLVRDIVGYRLGTLLSVLAMYGIIVVLYKLLRLILVEQKRRFHAGWGLLLVNAGIVLELFFQIATYLVDIVNAFFILLVLYWLLKRAGRLPGLRTWSLMALALGALIALKLTNIPLVLPLVGFLLWRLWQARSKLPTKRLWSYRASSLFFFVPLLLLWVPNYAMTRNPVFPYYNAIFQSADYGKVNFTDNFGGKNLAQRVVWPLASVRDQTQLAEPHQIYNDYKLVMEWSLAIVLVGLALFRKIRLGPAQKGMLYYFLASLLLWGLLSGIGRYAVSSTALGGLLIVMLLGGTYRFKHSFGRIVILGLAVILCVGFLAQDYRIMHFNFNDDISWRPTFGKNRQLDKAQLPYLFQKQLSVTPAQQKTIQHADILLNCNLNVAGWFTLLPGAGSKPVVNIISDMAPYYALLSDNSNYQQAVTQRLHSVLPTKKVYTWVSVVSDDVGPSRASCYKVISARGGTITSSQQLSSILGYTEGHLELISGTLPL